MERYLRLTIVLLAICGAPGCGAWQQSAPQARSLLKPIDLASDSVRLEIVSVRFPLGDAELNGPMWSDVDEQLLSLATRCALAENGIRAGIATGPLPPSLMRRIASAEEPPAEVADRAARLEQTPVISRQQMQLHSGWRGEIVTSNIYPELPLLIREDQHVGGRTYPQAQGILAAKAEALGDHRIKLALTPELHYGQPRQQWVPDTMVDGMIRPQTAKLKRTFDRLSLDLTLAPGQMLLLTSVPDRPGTLGHYFFTDSPGFADPSSDQLQQKLTVIRLAQSNYSDLFAPVTVADGASGNSLPLLK